LGHAKIETTKNIYGRRWEIEQGIDRQAQLDRGEAALREDRARAAGVKGAA
jgi:hypothetical protein